MCLDAKSAQGFVDFQVDKLKHSVDASLKRATLAFRAQRAALQELALHPVCVTICCSSSL